MQIRRKLRVDPEGSSFLKVRLRSQEATGNWRDRGWGKLEGKDMVRKTVNEG